jgi:hypothetical protein
MTTVTPRKPSSFVEFHKVASGQIQTVHPAVTANHHVSEEPPVG